MISIIVPVYNVEKYLNRCIDSILKQIYIDFEIILVNDGSTDSSGIICEYYHEQYPQIITVIHQNNQGLSQARNTGLEQAKGEYITFIDSDDFISPNYLYVLLKNMKMYDADISSEQLKVS